MRRFDSRHVLCLVAFALCWMLPASVFAADECASDADCDEGFICETYTAPCPAVDCPNDPNCGSCEPEEVQECAPAPPDECSSAADCSGDLVCVTYTRETCADSAPPCAPEQECDTGSSSDSGCTTETQGYCLPPYLAPCQSDSDCGAGFACEEAEVCSCSGSGSTGGGTGSDDGVDPDGSVDAGLSTDAGGSADSGWVIDGDAGSTDAGSYDDNCSCSGTGEFYCELQEQECTADSDCPGDLICDDLPWISDGGTVCTSDPGGNTTCEEEPVDEAQYCQPADLERWIGIGGGSASGSADFAHGGQDDGGSSESGELVSSDVDRGSPEGGSGGSGGGSSSACASAGPLGSTPAGALMAGLLVLGLGLVRRNKRA